MSEALKIGNIFVHNGLISPEELRVALEENEKHPDEKIGQTLLRLNYIDDHDLAKTLSIQLNIPYLDLETTFIAPEAIKLIPQKMAKKYHMLPIAIENKSLILAVEDPKDFEAIDMAIFSSGLKVCPRIAARRSIEKQIDLQYLGAGQASEELIEGMSFDSGEKKLTESEIQKLKLKSEMVPVIKMVDSVIATAVSKRASDIHVEPQEKMLQIRQRVDGVMQKAIDLPAWIKAAFISRLKIMAKMDIAERQVPQDGKIKLKVNKRVIDFRVSTLPTQYGEKVVIRILDSGKDTLSLGEIGLLPENHKKLGELINLPQGMILVCGPTGSGKTTTIYAALSELAHRDINIITLEDPIEYGMEGLNQVQINEKTGLTFAKALRSVLRQDPNVVFIGEIRDKETAEIALRAAMTGHLVISTLHTNDAVSTITRLTDMDVDSYLIASCLSGVVSQRLLRTICEECREDYEPPPEILQKLEMKLGREIPFMFYRGKGCEKCQQSGYRGRVPAHEILIVSDEIRDLIIKGESESKIVQIARKNGMRSMMEDALEKLAYGMTTVEEIERSLFTIDVAKTLSKAQCPQCHNFLESDWLVCPYCAGTVKNESQGEKTPSQKEEIHLQPEKSSLPEEKTPKQEEKIAISPEEGLIQETVSREQTTILGVEKLSDNDFQIIAQFLADFQGSKILFVDDERILRKAMEALLTEYNFKVTVAEDGEEALAKIAEDEPQLIITDIVMPKMDGLHMIKKLRTDKTMGSIPVIIISQRGDPQNRLEGFRLGIDDYLPKPFTFEELLYRVSVVLKRTYKVGN